MGVVRSGATCALLASGLAGCAWSAASTERSEGSLATPVTGAPNTLAEMYQRYATARTYEDHGIVVGVIRPDDGTEPDNSRTVFETAFDRATGSFRFEYTETHERFFPPDRHVIWRSGRGLAHVWWTIREPVEDTELDRGLAAMAGVSGGTSRTVPSMLLGWAAGMKRDLGYAADGEGVAGGTACLKMSTRHGNGTFTMWIGKDDHALHRLTEHHHIDGAHSEEEIAALIARSPEDHRKEVADMLRTPHPFMSEQTIDYAPVFDRPIDPARFAFTPPPPGAAEREPR